MLWTVFCLSSFISLLLLLLLLLLLQPPRPDSTAVSLTVSHLFSLLISPSMCNIVLLAHSLLIIIAILTPGPVLFKDYVLVLSPSSLLFSTLHLPTCLFVYYFEE